MTIFNEVVLVCGGLLTISNLIILVRNISNGYIEKKKNKIQEQSSIVKNMNDMAKQLKEINEKFDAVEEQLKSQKEHNENTEKCLQNMFRGQARELYYKCVNRGNKITAKELTDVTEAYDIYSNTLNGNHYFGDLIEKIKEFEVIRD